jgi:TRAP-type C4-dicarboxylate transport system permease small subunit
MTGPPTPVLHRLTGWYRRGLLTVGCTMLATIVIVMGVQVFFRYVLNNSLIWAEELCRYLLVWISFLFLGMAFQRGEMVALNLLLKRIGRGGQIALTLVAYGVSIALMAVLVWFGFAFANVNSIETLPAFDFIWSSVAGEGRTVDLSAFWLYAAVPIGAGLLGVHLAVALAVRLCRLARGEDVYAEAVEVDVAEGTR